MLKSCVALLLSFCMVLGMSVTVFADMRAADTNGDGIVKYVSIGDSVTNGFGMDGYKYEDGTNIYGFRREVETAYPAMIKAELEQVFGTGNVELDQLATSNFRMEELRYMLDDDYTGDAYMHRVFGSPEAPEEGGWFYRIVDRWCR